MKATGRNREEVIYVCSGCGYESRKWMGQCPGCREWNTFFEQKISPASAVRAGGQGAVSGRGGDGALPKAYSLSEIDPAEESRMDTGMEELSRVLGGGLVPGSLTLLGGDPGVGKSTLLLQAAALMADMGRRAVYISGEESLRQIRLRANRIGNISDRLKFVCETDIDRIIMVLEREKPELCVIDSIQTMYTSGTQSLPGSVTQIKECAQRMMVCAKRGDIATFLVGHVTKEGTVAGPRVLEHIVDTVLYFESGDQFGYRVLRSAKNRFGSTNEIGVFEMSQAGLKEVPNPSEYLLEGRPHDATGAVVTCLVEGSRPMLMEVQALVAETQYGLARRQANGMDYNRLVMLLAVLARRGGLNLGNMDAYVNIAGGMRITQPSADLAVIAAIISSYRNIVVAEDTCICGEVGLSGEVRSVPQAEECVKEASKLGFNRVILPAASARSIGNRYNIELVGVRYVGELYALLQPGRSRLQE